MVAVREEFWEPALVQEPSQALVGRHLLDEGQKAR
jgi:hypothetical protein